MALEPVGHVDCPAPSQKVFIRSTVDSDDGIRLRLVPRRATKRARSPLDGGTRVVVAVVQTVRSAAGPPIPRDRAAAVFWLRSPQWLSSACPWSRSEPGPPVVALQTGMVDAVAMGGTDAAQAFDEVPRRGSDVVD